MSKVIDFMEALGADAGAAGMDADAYAGMVSGLMLDPALSEALLARDQVRINDLLGGRRNVLSLLVPAEEEPDLQENRDQPDGGQEQESPEREPESRVA